MKARTRGMVVMMLVLACAGAVVQAEAADPFVASASVAVVNTEAGQLQGFIQHRIYTYLGVPYAKAERFMMPTKVEPWKGLRSALTYGEVCPLAPITRASGADLFIPPRYWPQNENCQFLNIWTPGIQDHKKRPVMVWLHPGGFANGSSISQVASDGANLSRKGDVVVVSLNHRLNVLGFLDLSAYGNKYKYSGNVGIADLVAALEWIRSNIAVFGGDPHNVTIFGQSGGGNKVVTLMETPAAKGLFQKAIVESGGVSMVELKTSRRVAELTLQNLGLKPEQVDDIQKVPYLKLIDAADKAFVQVTKEENRGYVLKWGPVVDGEYIPEGRSLPDSIDAVTAQSKDIPLMIGTTLNEFQTITRPGQRMEPSTLQADNKNTWSVEKVKAKLVEKYGDKASAIVQAFRKAYPDKKDADAYFVDAQMRPANLKVAQLNADQGGAPVYNYIFTYESPVMDGVGMAWHCSEIPYVFSNIALTEMATGGGKTAYALADKMSQAWINFARSGNPNHKKLPKWPAFTRSNGATMIFDKTCVVRNHHDEELMSFFDPHTFMVRK